MSLEPGTPTGDAGQAAERKGHNPAPVPRCSFCDQPLATVWRVVAGPGVFICSDCIQASIRMLAEGAQPDLDEPATFRVARRRPDGKVERLAHGPLPEPSDRRASPPVSAGRWLVVCPACGTWNVGEEIDACLQCAARLPGPGEPTNRPVPAWHIGFTRKELHAFTKPLRAALELAEVEAAHLRHAYMGTEHLLLGLLAQRQNRAAEILAAQGVTVAEVRRETLGIIAAGSAEGTAVKGFSQRAREVVRLAITEANERGQDAVGPEQLLLALVQEGKGVAVMVLAQLGIELDALRGQVLQLLPTDASDEQPPMTV